MTKRVKNGASSKIAKSEGISKIVKNGRAAKTEELPKNVMHLKTVEVPPTAGTGISPGVPVAVGKTIYIPTDQTKQLDEVSNLLRSVKLAFAEEILRHENTKQLLLRSLVEAEQKQRDQAAALGIANGIDINHSEARWNVETDPWRFTRTA